MAKSKLIFVLVLFCLGKDLALANSAYGRDSKFSDGNAKPKTVSSVMTQYGEPVRRKLKPLFQAKGISYPPSRMTWIAFKQEKMLYVFAYKSNGEPVCILKFPIIGASGFAGPKLKEGDRQVPEGFYRLVDFRPNVIAHLGLGVNYPNQEDRAHAKAEKRINLGFDILIHGSRWSSGCLAMGNEPIEELFVLTHDSGLTAIDLIFAPCNLLQREADIHYECHPAWVKGLHARLKSNLNRYRFSF